MIGTAFFNEVFGTCNKLIYLIQVKDFFFLQHLNKFYEDFPRSCGVIHCPMMSLQFDVQIFAQIIQCKFCQVGHQAS